ncbi:MAG: proline/glycine betaine ABC transporter permease [Deltaproteobacteria bacterium]|nr:proline/glycine betaine ABC transporter permease [Candidatus Anaeroferrophillus wilburensis]MBN2889621.1 proline/glycine betaine ABC transporter permease [Deltaproteobacteria bacterium]
MNFIVPPFPLEDIIEATIDFLTENFAFLTKGVSDVIETGIDLLQAGLAMLPAWVLIIALALLAWKLAGLRVALVTVLGLLLIWNLRLWDATVDTLILVTISTLVAVTIGIPLGISAALSTRFNRVIMPILDLMQTMPAFVYLIPAIPFFGLGPVSAIFSTVIFAMPPAIRLTCFGIQQVPADLVEAADAFGSSRSQKLFKLQIPLAMPTIMAGVNQTIMLSLSMVVIAAMIGAKGLGGEVWKAIQRLQPGKGFVAGIGVVIIAMILDRITQKLGQRDDFS